MIGVILVLVIVLSADDVEEKDGEKTRTEMAQISRGGMRRFEDAESKVKLGRLGKETESEEGVKTTKMVLKRYRYRCSS